MSSLLPGLMLSVIMAAGMMLVEFFGALRTFEFMAFAGNPGKRHGHDNQGEKFHRGGS